MPTPFTAPAEDVTRYRATAAEWTAANPVLEHDQCGFETDTGKTKWGDDVTAWTSLGYANDEGSELSANKDASGGYVGKTAQKINFKNAAATFISFLVNAATAARTYTFPDKDITVAGIVDIPVKATGAEVDTGTDDAKFVTAKAVEDSNYAKTAAITIAQAQTGSSITPCADNTYTTPTSITTVKGIITAIS